MGNGTKEGRNQVYITINGCRPLSYAYLWSLSCPACGTVDTPVDCGGLAVTWCRGQKAVLGPERGPMLMLMLMIKWAVWVKCQNDRLGWWNNAGAGQTSWHPHIMAHNTLDYGRCSSLDPIESLGLGLQVKYLTGTVTCSLASCATGCITMRTAHFHLKQLTTNQNENCRVRLYRI